MPDSTLDALNTLAGLHGEAEFLIDQDGTPLHVETVFTIKLDGEDPRDFFARAKREGIWQAGDRIRVPKHGRFDIVKIVRPAKS